MMISPESFAERYEGTGLEELIAVRNELIKAVCDFEAHCIDFEKHEMVMDDDGWTIDPGPDVHYQMHLEYLAEICKKVQEAFNGEYEQG